MNINDGLTDEERAALALDDNGDEIDGSGDGSGAGDGGSDAGDAGTAAGAGEGGDGGAGAGDAGANADAAAAGGADGAAAGGAGDDAGGSGAGAGDGAGEGAGASGEQPRPAFVAEAPADADARLKEIADKKGELRKQYDDGDITFDEFEEARDSLGKQEREIERALDKAAIAADMAQQQAKNDWNSAVGSFLKANTQYKEGSVLYRALDMEVKRVANENPRLSYNEILAKAHEGIVAEFGAPAGKTEQAKEETKPGVKKPVLPPTLRNVPSAEHADTSGNKYAALDRLAETDPMAYEEQLARMSKAERDAYCAQ
ncbi:hypothetical protein [Caballeronia zhejiangensis]|uniref:Scaffolding protein n=1 Tax=Caballeronia zhejiangensis TaxID=871203 RepID=A0A656QCR2_9BURK|nr:hypothetical protein [Caballeronia zhejiangensis]KDR25955.1 hypothetical protein BG60_26435 [Caballeronia zhejiangensis]